jgi:hypothetical protein
MSSKFLFAIGVYVILCSIEVCSLIFMAAPTQEILFATKVIRLIHVFVQQQCQQGGL